MAPTWCALTHNSAEDAQPAWSPNGTKIAFATNRDGNDEIYVMNANGSAQVNLTNHTGSDLAPAWSPDGTKLAFQSDRETNYAVWIMNADGSIPSASPTRTLQRARPAFHPTVRASRTNRTATSGS